MRFSLTALLTLAAASVVTAVNVLVETTGNPISQPTIGEVVVAGKPYTIVWDPSGEDEPVTLVLRKGATNNLDTLDTIAENIENKGTYSWTPESSLVGDDDYAIEILWGSGEDIERNYSPKFVLESDVKETTTTDASSTTAASTTSTATGTETTTMVTSTLMANTTSTSTTRSGSRPTISGEPVIPSDDKGAAGKVGISMLAVAAAAVAYFA